MSQEPKHGERTARTPEEQAIIDVVAQTHGREYAETYADYLLAQARAIGEI